MLKKSAFKMTYQPLLDRTALTGQNAIAQMADDMRVFTANAGSLTKDDLAVIGWRLAQIEKHGEAARELAYARSAA